MRLYAHPLIAVLLASCMAPVAVSATQDAQTGSPTAVGQAPSRFIDKITGEDMTWTAVAWTGDEAPLIAARRAVDERASRPGFTEFVCACRKVSLANPADKVAAYKWAYSSWDEGLRSGSDETLFASVEAAIAATNRDDLAKTYEGSRIRFLFESEITLVADVRLVSLGQRLLHHTPSDADVMEGEAGLYRQEVADGNVGLEPAALHLCQEAYEMEPGNPLTLDPFAKCYENSANYCDGWDWRHGKKMTAAARKDLELSINFEEATLKLVSPSDLWHADLLRSIVVDRSVLKQYGNVSSVQ